MSSQPGILIVGAGPTGLTLALELARQGIIADVIEQREAGSPFSRAVGLLPSSMRIFSESGVADAIRQEAMQYRRVSLFRNDHRIARVPLVTSEESTPLLLGLAQDRTEALLLDALRKAGGDVRFGVKLLALDVEGHQAMATWRAGTSPCEKRQYDILVGTDGVHSTVRRCLGIEFIGFDLPEQWSIADVDVKDWDVDEFRLFRLKGRKVVVVAPLEAQRVRIISNTPDAVATLPVPIDVVRIRRADTFRIAIRQVAQYRHGPVFLAGDAAHCHSPAGGRGMNLGIADAADLADRIVHGDLDGYASARHAAGRKSIEFSERARKMVTSGNPLAGALLTVMFKALASARWLRTRLIRRLLKVA